MADVDITELVDLEASAVSGVQNPANGTHFLLMKSEAPAKELDDEKDDSEDEAKKPFPGAAPPFKAKKADANSDDVEDDDSSSDDADDEDDSCDDDAMKSDSAESDAIEDEVTKAKLKAADRKAMPAAQFAYVDPDGGKHLPIHDKDHVKAALGRFNQTDFHSADAKAAAAGKIKAAAGKFGIDLSDDSNVASATKGAVQDALNGTATPEEGSPRLHTSQTMPWFTESMATPKSLPTDTPAGLPGISGLQGIGGGESTSNIPAESRVNGPAVANPGQYVKAKAASQLLEVMDAILAQRARGDTESSVRKANVGEDEFIEAPTPPSLQSLAQQLAEVSKGVDAWCAKHEQNAALGGGDPDDDSADLQGISTALDYALGVVARLSYEMDVAAPPVAAKSDGVSEVAKAYRRLRAADEKALRDAHSALTNVLQQHDQKAGSASTDDDSTEEDKIVTEVTKTELAEMVAKAALEVVKADREAQAAEQPVEGVKAVEKASEPGGLDGNISESELHPTKEVDADEIDQVPGAGSEASALSKALEIIERQGQDIDELRKAVQQFAKAPRQGGPVLDGQLRQDSAAQVQQGEFAKSEVDGKIEELKKSLSEASDPLKRDSLSQELTHQMLVRYHLTGEMPTR